MISSEFMPQVNRLVRTTEATFGNNDGLPSLGEAIRNVISTINMEVSNRVRYLAEKANMSESLNRLLLSIGEVRAIPVAIYDTLNITGWKMCAERSRQANPEIQYQWTLSIRDTFRYQLGFQKIHNRALHKALLQGYTRDKAKAYATEHAERVASRYMQETIAKAVERVQIQETKKMEARYAQGDTLYVSEGLVERGELFRSVLENAVQLEQQISVFPIDPSMMGPIRSAVVKVLQEIDPGFSSQIETVDLSEFNPISVLHLATDIRTLLPEQTSLVETRLSEIFNVLSNLLTNFQETIDGIIASRELTGEERLDFLREILVALGVPRAERDLLFENCATLRDVGEDFTSGDLIHLVQSVGQYASLLYDVNPEVARHFIDFITGAASATPEAASDLMEFFRDEGIRGAFVVEAAGDGIYNLLAQIFPGIPAFLLNIPNPVLHTGDFLFHCAEQVRNAWAITGVNTFISLAILGINLPITGFDFQRAWSVAFDTFTFLEKLIPIQLFATTFPRLQGLPFYLSFTHIVKLFQRLPLGVLNDTGDFLERYASILEGVGIGPNAMGFNQLKQIEARRAPLSGGGETWVARTSCLHYSDRGVTIWEEDARAGRGPFVHRGLSPRRIARGSIEIGSPVATTHIHSHAPLLSGLHNLLLRPLDERVYRPLCGKAKEVWQFKRFAPAASVYGGLNWLQTTKAGIVDLLFALGAPLFPLKHYYKKKGAPGVRPIRMGEKGDVKTVGVIRNDPYLHGKLIGNTGDVVSTLIGMGINMFLISRLGAIPLLREVSDLCLERDWLSIGRDLLSRDFRSALSLDHDWFGMGLDLATLGFKPALGAAINSITNPEFLDVYSHVMLSLFGTTDWKLFRLRGWFAGGKIAHGDPTPLEVAVGNLPTPEQNLLIPTELGRCKFGYDSVPYEMAVDHGLIDTDIYDQTRDIIRALTPKAQNHQLFHRGGNVVLTDLFGTVIETRLE